MAAAYPINPLYLLGSSFNFIQLFHTDEGPSPFRFQGRVVAVQVPAPGTELEWALLLDVPQFGVLEHYVPIEELHFRWPSPGRAKAAGRRKIRT